MLGEGVLSKEILNNQENLDSYLEVKEVLSLFREGCSKKNRHIHCDRIMDILLEEGK